MFIEVLSLVVEDPKVGFTYSIDKLLEVPSACPYCGAANQRFPVTCYCMPDNPNCLESIFYCDHCKKFFRVSYYGIDDCQKYLIANIYNDKHLEYFSESIKSLSPKFVRSFSQSEKAEIAGLDMVVGPGYRKALEFLIKDFAVMKNPQDEEKIYHMNLSAAINQYIDHSKIKSLAKSATWLGNDHTHSVQKHEDYDLHDLKRFIIAVAKYIDLELTVEEADALLQSKK